MLIQATNDFLYQNPVLGQKTWYMYFPEMEENGKLAIKGKNKAELKIEVNQILRINNKIWGKVDNSYKIYKDQLIFPPDWEKIHHCYVFSIKIINPIPEKFIIGFDVKLEPDIVEPSGIFLMWNTLYTSKEIKDIYDGKLKSFLFKDMSKNKIQRNIRDQLGIRSGKEILKINKEKIKLKILI